MLHVRGAHTVQELRYASLIILDFSTGITIRTPKAVAEIFCTILTCLISYTKKIAQNRMATLVAEGYTMKKGSWKAIVCYRLESLLHFAFTKVAL